MSFSDPIADMLTRIRNAIQVKHSSVVFPYSKIKEGILNVMLNEGYIKSFEIIEGEKSTYRDIKVELMYNSIDLSSVINVIERVSKPGRRSYVSIKDLGLFFNGLGIYILTTSKGIMSDNDARKLGVGGEILCKVF